MYNDENKWIRNQTCEYCNEQLHMFEKIIFPTGCRNFVKKQPIIFVDKEAVEIIKHSDNSHLFTENHEGHNEFIEEEKDEIAPEVSAMEK